MRRLLIIPMLLLITMAALSQKFLKVDFDKLDFNPVTHNQPIWQDRFESRMKRLGIDKITATLHVKGVGNIDPAMSMLGKSYGEKMTFEQEDHTIMDGFVSVSTGNYEDLFKWTLLYLTKYEYKTPVNHAIYGKFILYDFRTQKEADKLYEKLLKKKYDAKKYNTPTYRNEQYIIVTIFGTKPINNNAVLDEKKRLKKIDNIKF